MLILEDVKVLDFTQYLAGPTVGRLMAEMGAEIIKVELGPDGDPSRGLPVAYEGRSGYFVQQNRGKKSLGLNLKNKKTDSIIKKLVAKVDVVLENFGPGVMERKGWTYKDLKKLNSSIIMASISAYGRESALSHKTGYDWAAQAYSGLMHMNGERTGPPLPVGIGIADVSSGVHAFSAIGYALFHKKNTGEGQWLDISMVDSMFHMHDISLQGYSLTKGAWQPNRQGAHHELISPFGVFKGPTGYIVILALQPQWSNVCDAISRPELKNDPRYCDGVQRGKNQQEIIKIIELWMEKFSDNDSILAHLEQFRVPAAPVLDPVNSISDPYFRSREMIRNIEDPILGEMIVPGFPLKFSGQTEKLDLVAPKLGEHNSEVLKKFLNYEEKEIEKLHSDGVIISKPT